MRVKKATGNPATTTTVYIFSGTKVIAEYVNGTLSKEYIYSGSALLATHEGAAGATLRYHHPDHLGTRVDTDTAGGWTRKFGHFPFGESWYEDVQGNGAPSKLKFTSYERDSESGLDQAMFRYESPRLGRFMSADPLAGSLIDPQSLNRYTYVRNNPTSLIDPLGLFYGPCYAMPWLCGSGDSGGGGAGGTGGPPAPLLDTGGEAGGGGGGGGGGGEPVKPKKPYVDPKVLDKCVQELFGVKLESFTQSQPGENGRFVGFGPHSYGPHPTGQSGNNATITVTNDATSFNNAAITVMLFKAGRKVEPGTTYVGVTFDTMPHVNYTANNLSSVDPMAALATQIDELGHSLAVITTGEKEKQGVDNGDLLENCVQNNGGFVWR
jgi:RHS repeat-associated protein